MDGPSNHEEISRELREQLIEQAKGAALGFNAATRAAADHKARLGAALASLKPVYARGAWGRLLDEIGVDRNTARYAIEHAERAGG